MRLACCTHAWARIVLGVICVPCAEAPVIDMHRHINCYCRYTIDFKSMKQRNLATQFVRKIKMDGVSTYAEMKTKLNAQGKAKALGAAKPALPGWTVEEVTLEDCNVRPAKYARRRCPTHALPANHGVCHTLSMLHTPASPACRCWPLSASSRWLRCCPSIPALYATLTCAH